MKKRKNLTDTLGDVANSQHSKVKTISEPTTVKSNLQKSSRTGTLAITGHFPPEVRNQLKILAIEQKRTMEDMLAESLNMLFATYDKPEIAPRSKN